VKYVVLSVCHEAQYSIRRYVLNKHKNPKSKRK